MAQSQQGRQVPPDRLLGLAGVSKAALAVQPQDLMPGGVSRAGHEAGLDGRPVVPVSFNRGNGELRVLELPVELLSGGIPPQDPDRDGMGLERDQIVDGVGRAPRKNAGFPVLEDEHRSLAGNPGKLSEHELVRHQVAVDDDGTAGKAVDDFRVAAGVRGSHTASSTTRLASSRSSTTQCGWTFHWLLWCS